MLPGALAPRELADNDLARAAPASDVRDEAVAPPVAGLVAPTPPLAEETVLPGARRSCDKAAPGDAVTGRPLVAVCGEDPNIPTAVVLLLLPLAAPPLEPPPATRDSYNHRNHCKNSKLD